jgi:hypothetical protein
MADGPAKVTALLAFRQTFVRPVMPPTAAVLAAEVGAAILSSQQPTSSSRQCTLTWQRVLLVAPRSGMTLCSQSSSSWLMGETQQGWRTPPCTCSSRLLLQLLDRRSSRHHPKQLQQQHKEVSCKA